MHSRESHTHKVALVAREIADSLCRMAATHQPTAERIQAAGGLDIAACETAGLAHDLGHPPFGHQGERTLDMMLRRHAVSDGFEGNAQTFRIVTRLDSTRIDRQGMDLTNVTLAAILKYPWKRPVDPDPYNLPKFGSYALDISSLERALRGVKSDNWDDGNQTLEASIMDLADDIAYAIHDLEDFCTAGLIDMDQVGRDIDSARTGVRGAGHEFADSNSGDPFTYAAKRLSDRPQFNKAQYLAALEGVGTFVDSMVVDDSNTSSPASAQLREALSDRIKGYFGAIELTEEGVVSLDVESWHDMQALKTITRHYLISSPRMGLIQRAQGKVIENLFTGLVEWLQTGPEKRQLPAGLVAALNAYDEQQEPLSEILHANHFRAVSDYICGMSDSEALLRSGWVSGREVPGMSLMVESF